MNINYDLYEEIKLYAKRHTESSLDHYKSRNQNVDNIYINCLRGKLAEWCCYYSMQKAGYILKDKPDMMIYSENNKSYDADLICTGKDKELYDQERHIHVKSISLDSYQKYGASFLIQKNDDIVNNPKPNHYFSVMLQQSLTEYFFHKWINSCDVSYSEPRMSALSATKYAVYL